VSFGRRLAVLAASCVVVAGILLLFHDFVGREVFVLMVVAGAMLVYIIQPITVAWERSRQQRRIAPTPPGAESLIGDVAVVIESIDPVGRVKIHGETWRARSKPGEVLQPGERAVVVSCRELELVVRREHPS
jgi:membrane-bound ClpP family serine protease